MQKIEFLSFMVTPTGISMVTAKTDAVSVWPTPTSLKAVQVFLGFANFYCRFMVGFSDTIISQISPKDGNIHLIAFYSCSMQPAELNYLDLQYGAAHHL